MLNSESKKMMLLTLNRLEDEQTSLLNEIVY